MAEGVRYRYKGRYITEAQAARYNNLRNVKKYITTQYYEKKELGPVRRGYTAPVEKLIDRALKKSRQEAEIKRAETAPTPRERQREVIRRSIKRSEEYDYQKTVEKVARRAVQDDIDLDDALDSIGWKQEQTPDYGADDIIEGAEDFLEYDEALYDFEMGDLENEDLDNEGSL